ncbi:DUF5977 domain-containing protein [Chryseobacterium culicis]|uniref:DUF5977 domain-containing protein n=1 Tax=Chryseobacterium culicis TaxID=680127 RepID=A0A2S9CZJ9_CHRCI|nr:DUF5977 domain-containing protein [Chryseobacterium culicis]PRB85914.1 hypothetical protein CQ022_06580 [Chryseobacterium culicis]PRB91667.1 hypothetical protein CQ033_00250 [Chryseobacterium culicis]
MRIFFLFCIISVTLIKGQFNGEEGFYSPEFSKSPNSSEFKVYGGTNLNLSLGKPDVNINLLSLNIDHKNKLDVNINYDVALNKPDTYPSWTGLAWNLSTSGTITRNLNGVADESDSEAYYYKYSLLNSGDWNSIDKLKSYSYFYEYEKNEKALNPDTFSFYVNGISGTFIKNHEGKWIVNSDTPNLSVTNTLRNNEFGMDNFIYSFIITDGVGNKYTFGNQYSAIEIYRSRKKTQNPRLGAEFYKYVKNWHLAKIEYSTGKNVDFSYNKSGELIYFRSSYSGYKRFAYGGYGLSGCAKDIDKNNCFNLSSFEEGEFSYLDKVNFDNVEIKFNKSLANSLEFTNENVYLIDGFEIKPPDNYYNLKHWYKLDNISYSVNNKNVENIYFEYDENPAKRLKLKKIKIGEAVNNKYEFQYNNNLFPKFNNGNTDHWGYFNDKTFNFYAVNSTDINTIAAAYRQAKEPNFKLNEILEKIFYPTGGSTRFHYEPHEYTRMTNYNNDFFISEISPRRLAGGFRVSHMIDYNISNVPSQRKFYYVKDILNSNLNSSGVLSNTTDYNHNQYTYREISPLSWPLNYTNGAHIVYSKVYEEKSNGGLSEYAFSNQDNGFIDQKPDNTLMTTAQRQRITLGTNNYVWSNAYMEYNENAGTRINSFNSLQKERMKILFKKEYTNTKVLLAETAYNYNNKPVRFSQHARIVEIDGRPFGPVPMGWNAQGQALDNTCDVINVSAYKLYFYNHYLDSETRKDYFNNGNVTTTTKYFYDDADDDLLKKEETTYPDNKVISKTYHYANDVTINNQYLVSKNMIGIPLVTETTKIENPTNKILTKWETVYPTSQADANTYTSGLPLPKSVLSHNLKDLNSPAPVPTTEITYDLYDPKGNILQYTSKDGKPTTIIWGYGQTLPIAKIEGEAYSNVMTSLGVSSSSSGYTTLPIYLKSNADIDASSELLLIEALDNFRKTPALASYNITTYTYNPLIGVTSITSPSGIRENYTYDLANRLEKVVDNNGKVLKEYKYNNAPTAYYNVMKSQPFTKNNCTSGMISNSITYTVPEGRHFSIISQADADQKALDDINSNGQNYANSNLTCFYPYCDFNALASSQYIMMQYAPFQKVNHVVNAQLNFMVTSSQSVNWSDSVQLGNIPGPCWPTTTVTRSSGNWQVTLYQGSGQTVLRWLGSGNPSTGTPYNITFSYDVN